MPSKEAFVRIKMINPGAYLHMLYGLQGAIEGSKIVCCPKAQRKEVNKRSNMSPMTMSKVEVAFVDLKNADDSISKILAKVAADK